MCNLGQREHLDSCVLSSAELGFGPGQCQVPFERGHALQLIRSFIYRVNFFSQQCKSHPPSHPLSCLNSEK